MEDTQSVLTLKEKKHESSGMTPEWQENRPGKKSATILEEKQRGDTPAKVIAFERTWGKKRSKKRPQGVGKRYRDTGSVVRASTRREETTKQGKTVRRIRKR